jgi:hypothetical protein
MKRRGSRRWGVVAERVLEASKGMAATVGDEITVAPRAYRETRPRDAGTPAARAALEKLCGSKEGVTAPGAAVGVCSR